MSRKVNEIDHTYCDFRILAEYPKRDKTNGCVKWVCECTKCGAHKVIRGTHLRAGSIKGICYKCRYKTGGDYRE